MDVMFVVPPDTFSIEASLPRKEMLGERGYYPNLGSLYVAANLRAVMGTPPMYLDLLGRESGCEELVSQVAELKPDLVGISVLTFSLLDALKSARLIKQVNPRTKICFGGMHVNLFPLETLRLPEVDFVIHGEGERSFLWLVQALEQKASPEQLRAIPGLGWKDGDQVFLNREKDIIPDLNQLPFPARDLTNMKRYSHVLQRGNQFASIQSSRGCPFGCIFCDIRRTRFRVRSVENVLQEIRHLAEQGVDDLFFVDDTITVNKKRVREFCRAIVKSGVKVYFKISARTDTIDEELLADLREAGCYRIHYGVETATPRLLEYIDKKITPDRVRKVFGMTRAAGIQSLAYLMIGIPTETRQEMEDTIEFARALETDYVQFSICTPYPKTELYARLIEDGTISWDYWQAFAEKPTNDFVIPSWNPDFSLDELREIQSRAHRGFYGRPRYMVRELMKVRSWGELSAKIKMGGRMLLPIRRAQPPAETHINTSNG